MLADARLRPGAVRRFEQDVDRAIEFHLRAVDVPLLQFFLARLEVAFRGRNQRYDWIVDRCRRDVLRNGG
ncbi:MAG: hypothetical protein DMF97_03850 [Acidobacteria bacterium]|nr:MAG: hypothetical protein DMF97_03850 [Acidobacteriota bacterium]